MRFAHLDFLPFPNKMDQMQMCKRLGTQSAMNEQLTTHPIVLPPSLHSMHLCSYVPKSFLVFCACQTSTTFVCPWLGIGRWKRESLGWWCMQLHFCKLLLHL